MLEDKNAESIEMLLWCSVCKGRHVETLEREQEPHHTHSCHHCGSIWRPAIEETMGVWFLKGFGPPEEQEPEDVVEIELEEVHSD